jgi:molybdopterin converting factor small subunit
MRVRVSYYGSLRVKFSAASEDILLSNGARLRDLFLHLSGRYGELFKSFVFDAAGTEVRKDVLINVNDLPVRQIRGLETELKEGDQVDILPLFTGGG